MNKLSVVLAALGILVVTSICPAEPLLTDQQIQHLAENEDVFLLDVREPEEILESGTLPGATNIPSGEIVERLDELPRNRPILVA